MIFWTIKAAAESKVFKRIVVSTDSPQIAAISQSYGIDVPFLRTSAHDDYSNSSLATHCALMQSEYHWNEKFETVVQLMANCPFRTEVDIMGSLSYFNSNGSVSQISCFKYNLANPWISLKIDESGVPIPLFPDALKKRSQDLPELFCPSGAIWISNRDKFIVSKDFYMKGFRTYPLSWLSSIDIDNESDYILAKNLFRLNKNSNK